MSLTNKRLALLLIAATALTSFGFLNFGNKDAVAKVSHTKITKSELNDQIQQLSPNDQKVIKDNPENKKLVLNQMIDQELVVLEATKEGYSRSPEYKDQIENYKRNLLINMFINDKVNKNVQVTPEEVKAFYTQNKAQFEAKEERNVRHILISTNGRTDAEAKTKANNILKMAKAGKSSFEKLAATYSDHEESKNRGGELGYFQKGALKKEFSDAAFGIAKKGEVAGPIKTDLGYHVIELVDIRTRPEIPLAQVQQQIAQSIAQAKSRQLQQELLSSLKDKYTVEIFDNNLN